MMVRCAGMQENAQAGGGFAFHFFQKAGQEFQLIDRCRQVGGPGIIEVLPGAP